MIVRAQWLFLLVLLCLPISAASAHESRPAYLELAEQSPGTWAITWKQPVMGDQAVRLEPRMSNGWLDRKPAGEELTPTHYIRHWRITAPQARLAGSTITIAGLERTITDVVVHISTAKGQDIDTVLRRDSPRMTIDFGAWRSLSAPAYFRLGVEHILAGVDHLLFVAGLLLLAGAGWRLLGVITAFTLGHSLTLAASSLGWVKAPVPVIEALVALSIIFVARELLRSGRDTLTARRPWLIAALFGLLHGFAFAGALAETGLPESNIPTALLLFNLGVEAGQLAFVGALIVAIWFWHRLPVSSGANDRLRRLAPYAMGCYASFLFWQRTAAVFA